MKWSIVVAVLVAVGVAAGGGYYVLHQHTMQAEVSVVPSPLPREPAEAEQARRDIGTYQDAKHPSFPTAGKQE
jgi:hypothetical protein